MTIREFYQTVIEANISEDATNKANELLSALDARNEKRKSSDSKEKKEAAARRGLVLGFFQNNPNDLFTRDDVATALELTPAQVTAACKVLIADGSVTKSEVKVDKTKRVAYSYTK